MITKSMKLKNNKFFLTIFSLEGGYYDKTRPVSRYNASVKYLA